MFNIHRQRVNFNISEVDRTDCFYTTGKYIYIYLQFELNVQSEFIEFV